MTWNSAEERQRWRDRNREKTRESSRAAQRKYRYGLDREAFEALPKCCEVCGSTERLHVDHDHETGDVRGRLCHGCNAALGFAKDDPERLRSLAEYLEKAHTTMEVRR